MTTSPLAREALALIEHFEGYHRALPDGRAAPYLCPAKVATIGIGSTFYEGGAKVALTDPPITRDRAHELLAYELRSCEAAVSRLTTRRLSPLAFGALVAFTYNVGSGAYRASGLRRAVNARDDELAAREFLKWRLAGGVVLKGLERRRRAEAALYLKGIRDADVAGFEPVPRIGVWSTWFRSLRDSPRPDPARPAAAGAGSRPGASWDAAFGAAAGGA